MDPKKFFAEKKIRLDNLVMIGQTSRLMPAELKPPRVMKWIGRSPLWSGLRLLFVRVTTLGLAPNEITVQFVRARL